MWCDCSLSGAGTGLPRSPPRAPPRSAEQGCWPAPPHPCPACVPHAGHRYRPALPMAPAWSPAPSLTVPAPVSCFLRLDPSVLLCLLFLVLLPALSQSLRPSPAPLPLPTGHRAGGDGASSIPPGGGHPVPSRQLASGAAWVFPLWTWEHRGPVVLVCCPGSLCLHGAGEGAVELSLLLQGGKGVTCPEWGC